LYLAAIIDPVYIYCKRESIATKNGCPQVGFCDFSIFLEAAAWLNGKTKSSNPTNLKHCGLEIGSESFRKEHS
jgi:hypothetical protein